MKKEVILIILILTLILVINVRAVEQQTSNKVLCESSDGTWINEKCTCPQNSVGFKDGFGCDYSNIPQKSSSQMSINSLIIIILTMAVILVIILIVLVKLLKKKK